MLYSDKGGYKLHVVKSNPGPEILGVPKRVILTVNHRHAYGLYTRYESPPSEENITQQKDWKIVGDKRSWRVHHVERLMKPVTKESGVSITSYLIILEQDIVNPEKDLAPVFQGSSVKHLRKFNNLIVDEE